MIVPEYSSTWHHAMLHKQNRKDATRCDVSVKINEFEK